MDAINPDYYKRDKIEAIEVIEAFFCDNYHLGAAFKYMARCGRKDEAVQEIDKAIWYMQRYRDSVLSGGENHKPKNLLARLLGRVSKGLHLWR